MTAEKRGSELTPLQNAFLLLKQTQARLAALEQAGTEPIAIVGMGCRFPGDADDPASYWRLLREGRDAIREVPPDRWDVDEYYDPDPSSPGKICTRWGGFLTGVDEFDADFFGISPREAVRVDPQHRLLLEICWEALEDAGLPPGKLARSRTGVYVGVIASDYALLQSRDLADIDVFSGTGSSHAILANRVSYVLNLNGPSIALDTACSSSLVTVHLACQSLRRKETDLALAGGVNLILSPEMTAALSKAHMMSLDGRCKAFDAAADGYVRGEGCGMLVLKRLSDALADGDSIRAVIRGAAVNHDGRSNGLSAPNGPAQEEVIRAALADAKLEPHQISYVEAHGTGTRLGDPIEVEALAAVLAAERAADEPLLLGSVKTNIGHLESAAGIAGMIKAVLMLQHGEVPPHLHLQTINPLLKIGEVPIRIPTQLERLPATGEPRRIGISSFGFGGTNAHVIVEEAPAEPPHARPAERTRHLLTVSARSPEALAALASRYVAALESAGDATLADFAHAANAGRSHFAHRAAVVAATREEAARRLRQLAAGEESVGLVRDVSEHDQPPRIAFLFTGQGAQYAGMGRLLYDTQPTYRATLDRCGEVLRDWLDRPLLSLLEPEAGHLLDQTGYTQPVMFSLQVALAELWRSWGVEPAAVMGHSVGEFAAACVAGVYGLEEGLQLIAERARLMQSLPAGGRMAAVFASPDFVETALRSMGGGVAIAALNGPQNVVVSGDEPAVLSLLERLEREGIGAKLLATSHAFHSHRMDPILDELDAVAASIASSPPRIEILSNLTAQPAAAGTYSDPGYWSRHARQPVRFAESIAALADGGCDVFLEIGPQPVLIGMGQRCLPGTEHAWLPSLRPGRDDWQCLLESLAAMYVRGTPVAWRAVDRDYASRRVELPHYAFQRRRYWAKSAVVASQQAAAPGREGGSPAHPLLGRRVVAAVSDQIFESQIARNRPPLLADHVVQGATVVPGAAYLEMVLAASAEILGQPWTIRRASFLNPLLAESAAKRVQTILTPAGAGRASFRVVAIRQDDAGEEPQFTTLATGQLEQPVDDGAVPFDLEEERARYTDPPYDDAWRTEAFRKSNLQYGPAFQWCHAHWVEQQTALGAMRGPREEDRAERYQLHPGLLDCAFQLAGGALPGAGTGIGTHVPMAVERLRLYQRPTGPTWHRAALTSRDANSATADIQVIDERGRLVMGIDGLRLHRVPNGWLSRLTAAPAADWLYQLDWIESPLELAALDSTSQEAGRWLVFDAREGLGAAVAERLEMKGHACRVVSLPCSEEARRAEVASFLANEAAAPRGIVYVCGGESWQASRTGGPDFGAARQDGWGGVLDVVRAIADAGLARPPRLWLVTRGTQDVDAADPVDNLADATIWGLGRVIASEHPELSCTRIDLAPQASRADAEQLVEELWANQQEDQLAFRRGQRFAARLRRLERRDGQSLELPHGQPYRLEIVSRGQLDSVQLEPTPRLQPGPGQVEIRVRATGLNFRDVLNLLDLYPGDPGPLGGECAGEVVAVGEGVTQLQPGDHVVALAPASFSSFVITLGEFTARKPEHLSFAEAAALPVCFLTVQYALRRLGRIQRGERILIHAASGGVGMAAIQVARQAGAEIFATAGSQRKREFLQSLGIQHVFDSRSVDFADRVLDATGGEGVDLVLNSLTGETIAKSLATLRAGGRFLELGKTDLWDQRRVDQARPGVTFHAIALDQMMAEQPALVGGLMGEVMDQFANGQLIAPPLQSYPIQRVVAALRQMARAEHIGKIVIEAAQDEAAAAGVALDAGGSYLVTGGLGGLGLKLADWLVDRGARQLVLVGRSAATAEARPSLEALEQKGAAVLVERCEISNRQDVERLLARIGAELPPLKGVFHLAGVLDDGILREQTRERFDRVMGAKMMGAWHLHDLTRELPLDLFVCFSSAASLLGSPGQGNYAAANAFLDALAHHRRAHGLPALSVNWGSWAEVGMAARLRETEGRRWSAAGIGWIEPERGMETLERLIAADEVQAGVLPVDWPKFFARIPPGSEPAWLSEMAQEARRGAAAEDQGPPVLREQLEAAAAAERRDLALTCIRQQAARVLALDDSELPDPRRPLNELGFDSLTGVEFCNRVGRSIGQPINPTLLFDYPTLESLTGYVLRDVLKLEADEQTNPPGGAEVSEAARQQVMAEVEEMSEEEMVALVEAQINRLQ